MFSCAKYNSAWFHHTTDVPLPRSRLAEHGEHPAQFVHLHFLSQLVVWGAHHGLHGPATGVLVVVVNVVSVGALVVVVNVVSVGGLVVVVSVVSVVVASPPWQEQQGSPAMPFEHDWHSKDPPAATQAFMFLSSSHVAGVVDVGAADDVVLGVVDVDAADDVVVGGLVVVGHSSHWHLFSYWDMNWHLSLGLPSHSGVF